MKAKLKEITGRGVLTDEIRQLALKLLDEKDFGTTELRLLPYIQFVMMNDQRLDPRKINQEERKILQRWRERGFMEGGASGLSISRDFWNAMHIILWHGYVAYRGD